VLIVESLNAVQLDLDQWIIIFTLLHE